MRLLTSPTSPFARKVMACAIARGIGDRIEPVATSTGTSEELPRLNPLGKIPVLLLGDGTAVFDSPVICEYLDTVGEAPPLVPPAGPARLRAAILQALADGIMDAAVARRLTLRWPREEGGAGFDERQRAKMERGLDRLEAEPPRGLDDVGAIAAACALGYLDLRFPAEPWRGTRPALAAWLASVAALPPLARTEPRE